MKKEYFIKYRVATEWHEPHNTTTYSYDTEVVEAENAREAVTKVLKIFNFSNPNMSTEIISVKSI